MNTSRTPLIASAFVAVMAAGAVTAYAQAPVAAKDAAKASFWATPPPKATAEGGWGTAKAAPAPVAAATPKAQASVKVAAKADVPVAPRVARRQRARPAVTLAWLEPQDLSASPALATVGTTLPAPAAPAPPDVAAPAPAATPERPAVAIAEGVVTTAAPAPAAPVAQAVTPPKDPARPSPVSAPAAAPASPFPAWVSFSVINRGRVEGTRSIAVRGSETDHYYLNRLRVRALFTVSRQLEVFGEGQDSRVANYDGVGVPRNMRNVFDLRQAYVDVHARGGKLWRLRAGRQELALGDGRLIASPDWGNTNRTYDMVRGSVSTGRFRIDAFGGQPVVAEPDLFDRRKQGEYFYGAWTVIDKLASGTAIEPFVIVKHNDGVVGEDLALGDADLVTIGVRATSKLWRRFDTATDLVVQQGAYASDDIRAWAFHQQVGYSFASQPWKPRFVVDYATASGDDDPKDSRRQTFDQLYSSNHARYGLADQVGWRNMHDLGATVEATPHRAVKVGVGVHQFLLATVNDGFYGSGGSRVVLNRKATSRDIGTEVDGWFQWTVSKELSLSGGLGTLFAGDYLEQSTDGRTLFAPYLIWNVKF